MGSIENYRLVSVRKVAVYPDIILEGKVEITSQNTNSKKYVYLVFEKQKKLITGAICSHLMKCTIIQSIFMRWNR